MYYPFIYIIHSVCVYVCLYIRRNVLYIYYASACIVYRGLWVFVTVIAYCLLSTISFDFVVAMMNEIRLNSLLGQFNVFNLTDYTFSYYFCVFFVS